MHISSIKDLLAKYERYVSSHSLRKEQVIDIVQKNSGVRLTDEEFIVKKGELCITVSSPVMRNELFFYKQKILDAFKAAQLPISDIR